MVNGPASTEAVPLERVVAPELVNTKLNWALAPTATTPKSSSGGEIPSCGAVIPDPVTVLVLLPPLETKATALLKFPGLVGLNATDTVPVCPTARLNGLPLAMLN